MKPLVTIHAESTNFMLSSTFPELSALSKEAGYESLISALSLICSLTKIPLEQITEEQARKALLEMIGINQ